jgi:ABC-type multidrug transport system permease subunit
MLDVVAAFASWVPWLKGMTWQVWSRITLVTVLGTLIWLQWFWISAVWRGWKIKARWYEMVLVMLASFGGLLIGGILAWAVLGAGEWLGDWLSIYGF